MKPKWTTPEGFNLFKTIMDGESITWIRRAPQLRREIDIYPEMLTPEQRQRLNELEQELLELAYKAEEETRTVLKEGG